MAKTYRHAVGDEGKRYTKKVDRPDKYTTYWGTRATVNHKTTWSIKHARHPLFAWCTDLKDLAIKLGTYDDREAVQRLREEIEAVVIDFNGIKTWKITVAGVKAKASIVRLVPAA